MTPLKSSILGAAQPPTTPQCPPPPFFILPSTVNKRQDPKDLILSYVPLQSTVLISSVLRFNTSLDMCQPVSGPPLDVKMTVTVNYIKHMTVILIY